MYPSLIHTHTIISRRYLCSKKLICKTLFDIIYCFVCWIRTKYRASHYFSTKMFLFFHMIAVRYCCCHPPKVLCAWWFFFQILIDCVHIKLRYFNIDNMNNIYVMMLNENIMIENNWTFNWVQLSYWFDKWYLIRYLCILNSSDDFRVLGKLKLSYLIQLSLEWSAIFLSKIKFNHQMTFCLNFFVCCSNLNFIKISKFDIIIDLWQINIVCLLMHHTFENIS